MSTRLNWKQITGGDLTRWRMGEGRLCPGDTATNLVWRTLMVFLPIFYTDVLILRRSGRHTA
jgi:hypothetical protein